MSQSEYMFPNKSVLIRSKPEIQLPNMELTKKKLPNMETLTVTAPRNSDTLKLKYMKNSRIHIYTPIIYIIIMKK